MNKIDDIKIIHERTGRMFSLQVCKDAYEAHGCNVETAVAYLLSLVEKPSAEMDDKNKIDVSQEACDRRISERKEKERKRLNRVAYVLSILFFLSLIFLIAAIVLVCLGEISPAIIISSIMITILLFALFGETNAKYEKLGQITNEEYVEENLKEILKANADQTVCPYCGSTHVTFHKKGFNEGKALLGVALIGYWGAFWGVPGKNKIKGTCLKCGHSWTVKRK